MPVGRMAVTVGDGAVNVAVMTLGVTLAAPPPDVETVAFGAEKVAVSTPTDTLAPAEGPAGRTVNVAEFTPGRVEAEAETVGAGAEKVPEATPGVTFVSPEVVTVAAGAEKVAEFAAVGVTFASAAIAGAGAENVAAFTPTVTVAPVETVAFGAVKVPASTPGVAVLEVSIVTAGAEKVAEVTPAEGPAPAETVGDGCENEAVCAAPTVTEEVPEIVGAGRLAVRVSTAATTTAEADRLTAGAENVAELTPAFTFVVGPEALKKKSR